MRREQVRPLVGPAGGPTDGGAGLGCLIGDVARPWSGWRTNGRQFGTPDSASRRRRHPEASRTRRSASTARSTASAPTELKVGNATGNRTRPASETTDEPIASGRNQSTGSQPMTEPASAAKPTMAAIHSTAPMAWVTVVPTVPLRIHESPVHAGFTLATLNIPSKPMLCTDPMAHKHQGDHDLEHPTLRNRRSIRA